MERSKRHRSKRSSNHIHYDQEDFSIQCSAYFLGRIDLNDYAEDTLKDTVDSIVSGPKSKGLKVKLSLPDDGLIIENTPDPDQSWMYKTSELLYFWRDYFYTNIIVIITINRTDYQTDEPYSASIFRLRGHDSFQLFLQRAQEFFAQVLTNNSSIQTEHTDQKRKHNKKTKQSVIKSSSSKTKIESSTSRTEFEPKKTTNSKVQSNKNRTYSETTTSSDTRSSNSKKSNNKIDDIDNDDKLTTISSQIANEYVTELLRELKELRNEIAALKLETRFSAAVRSSSTSPIAELKENSKTKVDLKPLESDAETQTDLTLIDDEKNKISTSTNKNKKETKINKRTIVSNNDREESPPVNSSPTIEQSSSYTQAEFQPKLKLKSNSNSNEKDFSLSIKPIIIKKEIPKVLSKNTTYSVPKNSGEIVSFNASLDDTITSPENIYENLPIFIKMNSNDQKENKKNVYLTIAADQNSEVQKEYLSQLFGPQNGIALLLPKQPIDDDFQPTNNHNYFQQTLFSDHLTNPLFNVDKQLLSNTIANQFGIDHKSPSLQKLITNQHLFVGNKRTFANMIWQMSPEEENDLYSSPETKHINVIDSNISTAKSILKQKKSSRSLSKGRRISWDNTLE